MYPVRATQIKAARAILDWSQHDLAQKTGLSVATIRNLEMGNISPRGTTNNVVRQAIESAGLEFIDPEGIKRRLDEAKIYQGPDSWEFFLDDILQTVKGKNGEVLAVLKSQDMVTSFYNVIESELTEQSLNIKCLTCDIAQATSSMSPLQIRQASKNSVGPISYFVYGDKHALVLPEGQGNHRFVVLKVTSLAQSYRDHFLSLWQNASLVSNSQPE